MYRVYLPIVNKEIGKAIAKDIRNKADEVVIDELMEDLQRKNPVLANFIKQFASRTDNPTQVMFCSLLVYKLLENQAEINAMNEEIKL